MAKTVSDVIVDALVKAGVQRIYGIPGDSIDPLVDSLRRHRDLHYVQVRHEEGAAFAASVEAKVTGRLTACMGTSGPGSIHLLNGLYDAKMDHAPVIALTGQVESDLVGRDYFQEVNLVKLFDDVAVFNASIVNPSSASYLAWRATHESRIKRGVAHLNLPVDVLRMEAQEEEEHNFQIPTPSYSLDLDKVVELVDQSSKPAVIIGGGARGAGQKLGEFAERIGAPVIYALNGKGVMPDSDPKVMGGIGLLGTKPSVEALGKCDLLILLGTSFPYTSFLPGKAKVVQVDVDPGNIGKRVRVDLGLVGTVDAFLDGITGRVKEKEDKFYAHLKDSKEDWERELERVERLESKPLKPQRVARVLSERAAQDALVVVDTGNVTMWGARHFRASGGQTFLFSAWLGSMGVGVPGAVGASMAFPERQVLALVGDGGFAMTMMEVITAVKYSRPVKIVVFNNSKLGMIKFEQEVMGYPEWGVDLNPVDFASVAKGMGAQGLRVEEPGGLEEGVEEMLSHGGPFVLDVVVDPNERPMPPKLTFKQAKNYVISLFKEALEST